MVQKQKEGYQLQPQHYLQFPGSQESGILPLGVVVVEVVAPAGPPLGMYGREHDEGDAAAVVVVVGGGYAAAAVAVNVGDLHGDNDEDVAADVVVAAGGDAVEVVGGGGAVMWQDVETLGVLPVVGMKPNVLVHDADTAYTENTDEAEADYT